MCRKLIAAVSLVGVAGAFALALVLGASTSGAGPKVDSFGCRLIIVDGVYKTICSQA